MRMSEESQELLQKFFYHLAVELGMEQYGESPEADNLYRKVAFEMMKVYFIKEELPEWVANKLDEFASSFGFKREDIEDDNLNKEQIGSVEAMIWDEIKHNFSEEENGETIVSIDAWKTNVGEEEGKVIANVIKNAEGMVRVEYKDERAKENTYAQEVIQESIKELEAQETTTYIMIWIDEEEKWYYFINEFNPEQFPNGYVDYTIEVKNGIIVKDTFKSDTIEKPFEECYEKYGWDTSIQ